MRYALWTLRLGYAAWLVPAGLNHFYPLFPQPLGNQPASTALITALIDSGLFAIVKAVELFAGLALLFGWRVPLALVVLMPVSFNVWYWDVPLQGWGSPAAWYGWAVLLAVLLLMLAYRHCYAALLDPVSRTQWPPALARRDDATSGGIARLLTPARLLLGVLLLAEAAIHFAGSWVPFPVANTPMALELLEGLHLSALMDVAMGLQVLAGLALLAGRFVPLALAAVMPVLVCALFWAVVLEGEPGWMALTALLVLLAALLMFAHLPAYAGMLQPRPLASGESEADRYERRYAWPVGQTAPAAFAIALVPLALVAAFYHFIVPSMLVFYCIVTLLYPLGVLVLRLLQGLLAQPERAD
jgi:uncharacterized membrane protein YphA (DoxX/SURF4 family)